MKKTSFFSLVIYFVSLALLASLYTFIVIPKVRKDEQRKYLENKENELSSMVSVLTYVGESPLTKGVIITDINRESFKEEKRPREYLVENPVYDFDLIKNMELKYTLVKGQQLSFEMLGEKSLVQSSTRRLKEFKVMSLVADHVNTGSYIDVLARYQDGSYDLLLEKIRVYDILSEKIDNKWVYSKDKDGYYTFILALDEREFMLVNSALLMGYLDTRLYFD